MKRSKKLEILDTRSLPPQELARVHRDLNRINRGLGNTEAVIGALRRSPFHLRRVLDIGCGAGAIMQDVRRRLGVEVVGVDLRPPGFGPDGIQVVQADAVRDSLPKADAAYSVLMGHHLSEDELAAMIVNVGRSCRRFILLDLVRHPLPLGLFNIFVAPFVSPVTAHDGRLSVRRAFKPAELLRIAQNALANTGALLRHSVSPFYTRQAIDIEYRPAGDAGG